MKEKVSVVTIVKKMFFFVHLASLLCRHLILHDVDVALIVIGVLSKMLSKVSTRLEGRREARRLQKKKKKLFKGAIGHGRLEL